MIIEVLFSEMCNLFGDMGNVRYLQKCLPDAQFIQTDFMKEPAFVTQDVSLVYLGSMTEQAQEKVAGKLLPYKERIEELCRSHKTIFLVTGNAVEIFGKYIENEDGTRADGIGMFPTYAKRDMMHRYNGLVWGKFENIDLVGFKSQFSMSYGESEETAFFHTERGIGMNPKSKIEGVRLGSFFGTYLIGPILVLNPLFTEYLLREMGESSPELAFSDVIMQAYERRLKEFKNPKTRYE